MKDPKFTNRNDMVEWAKSRVAQATSLSEQLDAANDVYRVALAHLHLSFEEPTA